MAGGVGGTLLPPGSSGVGLSRVVGAGRVVATGVVGAGPVVVERVVGAGRVVARGVVGVRSAAGGAVGEGLSGAWKVVEAGPAVARGGVVSGDWADEDAARGWWTVVRGAPVLGAWAVGVVALEKGRLGSPRSPGPGDASTCPAAPPPPVTFPAEVAEAAAAAAAAQHNRARTPRLGRLLMARSAPPFIHSVIQSVGQSSSPPCTRTREAAAAATATGRTIATSL